MNIPTGGDPRHVLVLVGVVYVLYSLDPKLYLNSALRVFVSVFCHLEPWLTQNSQLLLECVHYHVIGSMD